MKKLRTDSSTIEISRRYSGEQILTALHSLVDVAAKDATDYVRPYVYLVALSKLSDVQYLRSAADIPGTERWDWFRYIQQVLMETYSPLISTTIKVETSPRYSIETQLIRG
jgi:hypothetical protein